MGARSGSGGGGTPPIPKGGGLAGDDGGKKIKITKVESLVNMKDGQMYKATKEAISRYESALGVRQRDVKLANMPASVFGCHATAGGKSDGIYLNSKYFKGDNAAKTMKSSFEKQYKDGWQTKTNKPLAHVVTHELAHATWNNHLTSPNAVAAKPEITKLYNSWLKDRTYRKGYGQYAKTNVNEFWAETCTKAVHGNSDRYTRAVKSIIRKYKL